MEAGRPSKSLSERDSAALILISTHPDRSVDWLRRRLDRTHSGAVRLIDRLQRDGLVRRDNRGREVALRLTLSGEHRVQGFLQARSTAIELMMKPLDEAERAILAGLVRKMLAGRDRNRVEADAACRLCDWAACADDCPIGRSVPRDGAAAD
jgi:DNA-binding MarR family transcriptional regulator